MNIVFARTKTDKGPRTIVLTTPDGHALSESFALDDTAVWDDKLVPAMVVLPERPAYSSVAQIVALRDAELEKELKAIERRNKRRKAPDNVTRLRA